MYTALRGKINITSKGEEMYTASKEGKYVLYHQEKKSLHLVEGKCTPTANKRENILHKN